MQIKLNGEFFKRGSTWLNIMECLVALAAELLIGMPGGAGYAYIAARVGMAIMQGIKLEIKQNGSS